MALNEQKRRWYNDLISDNKLYKFRYFNDITFDSGNLKIVPNKENEDILNYKEMRITTRMTGFSEEADTNLFGVVRVIYNKSDSEEYTREFDNFKLFKNKLKNMTKNFPYNEGDEPRVEYQVSGCFCWKKVKKIIHYPPPAYREK